MMVGRFSGATAGDIQAQVDKSLYYERAMTAKDTWLKNAFAGSDKTEADDIAAIDYIVAGLKKYTYGTAANSISQYDLASDETKILNAINGGVGVHFNASHGDNTSIVDLNTSMVGKMTNKGKYPFNFTSACNAGTFNAGKDCLGEALLKKPNAGFVGAFMASILTPWYEPYVALKEQGDVLSRKYPDNVKKTYGGVAVSGCMKMIDKYPKTGPWVSNALILFGDPSLQLYTDQPAPISIVHPQQIGAGPQSVAVTGTEGATVCLYRAKSGLQEVKDLIGGKATFSITVQPDASDTLYITGTMTNHETYESAIAVSAATGFASADDAARNVRTARKRYGTPVYSRLGSGASAGGGNPTALPMGPVGAEAFDARGKALP
jgi:gingipain R